MSKRKNTIKFICLSGIMAAMYVGLDFLAVSVSAGFGGTLKISLSGLPVIIVAIFGGPIWGAATGFIGAFIGQMITYGMSATKPQYSGYCRLQQEVFPWDCCSELSKRV